MHNVIAPFLIMLTAFVSQVILLEASLSHLGLGVQEPTPWGFMLQGGAEAYLETALWEAMFSRLEIILAVFPFTLFGDAVHDRLDPKLQPFY